MNTHYFTLHNGVRSFLGDSANTEVFNKTVSMAENCPAFQMDVEDEIVFEDETTCFNCRYRRWNPEGFTCYKQFPINVSEENL